MKKRLLILTSCIVMVFLINYLVEHIGYNRSDSVNFTIYWHKPIKEIKKGRYYVIDYVGNEYQGLINKRVACLPDDTLVYDNKSFYCNGELISTLTITHDTSGNPYPQFKPDNYRGVFVVGDSKDSYDSRYFGVLPVFSFKREVTPIW